ncbi:MAG: hypothetical protein ACE5FA_09375 [Dehalococcoidia bacterium]
MNPILENIYPDKTVFERRQRIGLPQLTPAMDAFTAYLHEEMRACFLNGHDHAALVMACALMDFAVKNAIHFALFVKADCVFDPDTWDEIDKLEFAPAINRAKSAGVVTKDEWKELEWLRKHIRNIYMHGQTPPWLKDKDAEGIIQGNLETGEVMEQTVKLREDMTLQRYYRTGVDRNICDQVIRLVDGLVRKLVVRSKNALDGWKAKNPSKPTRHQVERILHNMEKQGLEADLIIASDIPADMPNPSAEPDAGSGDSDEGGRIS